MAESLQRLFQTILRVTLDAVSLVSSALRSRSQLAAENLFLRKLAKRVFQTFDAPLDLSMLRDEYVEGLQTVIEGQDPGARLRHLRLTRE